jgi:hypothetical protein
VGRDVGREVPARWVAVDVLPVTVDVWFADTADSDGSRSFHFALKAGPVTAGQYTTRAGIEAIRDACNAALARVDTIRVPTPEELAEVPF